MHIPENTPAVAPAVAAALLLSARPLLEHHDMPAPSAAEILAATGAGRSRAYELAGQIRDLLPTLLRSPGRPPAEPTAPDRDAQTSITRAVLRFVMEHPGCVSAGSQRTHYADGFRRFILELYEGQELSLADFAAAAEMPRGTLEGWLRCGRDSHDRPAADRPTAAGDGATDAAQKADPAAVAQVETVLEAWRHWYGRELGPFVVHLQQNLHLPFGTAAVATILFEHGERNPRRRGGRNYADEESLRGTFETFFSGAQWVGDGTELAVYLDDEKHAFNLELTIDAFSGAWVGFEVSDTEDSAALCAAFALGKTTTGAPPLDLLLDNRESNHTPEVDAVLGDDTQRTRATLGRAQNKAHVEGAFGLFEQQGPPLIFSTGDRRELARQMARLAVDSFARGLNRRPRSGRGGRTRIELYGQLVSDEARQEARLRLRERHQQLERARQTRQARRDPVVADMLDDAFERFGLLDPERRVRNALATHPVDTLVDAIAIFHGKRDAQTLPAGADARYLLGIAKNLDHVHQADAITEALLRERLTARDRFLAALCAERENLTIRLDPRDALRACIDRALKTARNLDQHFWLDAAAQIIRCFPQPEWLDLARAAARRIHATFRIPRSLRSLLERRLLRRLWPLR